jgi:hypothetical protein
MSTRRLTAVVTIVAAAVALAAVLAIGSNGKSAKPAFSLSHLTALHEGGAAETNGEEGGAAAEDYSDRAYPADSITIDQIQTAIAANTAVEGRANSNSQTAGQWDPLGPNTLNVDRLGTQSFIKPTQWSGRVTALAVDPKCRPAQCRLYTAAAGGGVWRSTNALSASPNWQYISDGIPTNAIGSIFVDPNDKTGQTIYVGTGEANSSGDSEAGLGLYKTTDGGAHWSLVPGSFAAANNRAIAWIAVQPGNASHILIGTRSGTHGLSSNGRELDDRSHSTRGRRLQLDRRRGDVHAHAGGLDKRGQVRPDRLEHRLRSAGVDRPDPVDCRRRDGHLADDLQRQPRPLLVLAGDQERQDPHLPR